MQSIHLLFNTDVNIYPYPNPYDGLANLFSKKKTSRNM